MLKTQCKSWYLGHKKDVYNLIKILLDDVKFCTSAKNEECRMLPGERWDWVPCIWSFWKHPCFKYIQASLSTILLSYLAHPFNNISSINQAVYIFLSNLKRLGGGEGWIYPTSWQKYIRMCTRRLENRGSCPCAQKKSSYTHRKLSANNSNLLHK